MDYISDMRITSNILVALLLILGNPGTSLAQEGSHILKRQLFKVPLTSINISPDGLFLLAGFDDGSFRLLDPDSFEVKLEVEGAHYKAINAMDMPPKMDFILTAGGNQIKLWDRSGKYLFDWKGHATTIWNMEISSDGLWAVSSAMNKTFLLWDVYNSVIKEKMRGHEDVTMAVCISNDNHLIASGSNDQSLKIWNLETRQVISQLHGPAQDIYDVEFSPDNTLLVAASKDKSARLYDLKEEQLLHLLKGHQEMVLEAEFSPDGNCIVTASADKSIMLWDVETGERIHQFLDNEGAVMDLVFHPGGQSFYSISYAGDLTRWMMDHEIFVLKYYETPFREELAADPLFEPRQKGESKKDYQTRMEKAAVKKNEIIERFYQEYLQGKGK
ncbi:MAG: WD40 repeat domain-containing protein [Bacteroidota bacterium]|nr:WD40 repeat domain-containing protein [Bacteroidota bacterium]